MYSIFCQECKDNGKIRVYDGETGRNGFTRGLEHKKTLRSKNDKTLLNAWMFTHAANEHNGKIPEYSMKLVKKFQHDPMGRQISEGILQRSRLKEESLNEKTEWRQPGDVKPSFDRDDKFYTNVLRKDIEERIEKDNLIKLKPAQRRVVHHGSNKNKKPKIIKTLKINTDNLNAVNGTDTKENDKTNEISHKRNIAEHIPDEIVPMYQQKKIHTNSLAFKNKKKTSISDYFKAKPTEIHTTRQNINNDITINKDTKEDQTKPLQLNNVTNKNAKTDTKNRADTKTKMLTEKTYITKPINEYFKIDDNTKNDTKLETLISRMATKNKIPLKDTKNNQNKPQQLNNVTNKNARIDIKNRADTKTKMLTKKTYITKPIKKYSTPVQKKTINPKTLPKIKNQFHQTKLKIKP